MTNEQDSEEDTKADDANRVKPQLTTFNQAGDDQTIVAGETITPPDENDMVPGSKLGKYEIRRLLGKGAMGAVYLAFDPMIEREVAIKVLPPDIAARPTSLQRFLTEARSTGRLSHPNVVSIFDISEQDGRYYIVMEVLAGGSLADQGNSRKGLSWKEACRMVAEAADGLSAAHAAGLVHRDVKPENLMVTADGIVKVVDFGLSKLIDAASDTRDAATRDGTILGTPQYMSPEQCESADVDFKSDIYSLGGTLFHLLTGRHPYQEISSILHVMMAHASKPVPDPLQHCPDIPAGCRDIVLRAMAKQPADRYSDASEMAAELRSLIYGRADQDAVTTLRQDSMTLASALIVEPSRMQALVLSRAFESVGTDTLRTATTLNEAQEKLGSNDAQVVVTSMQLADGRGTDLLPTIDNSAKGNCELFVLKSGDVSVADYFGRESSVPFALTSTRANPQDLLAAIQCSTRLEFLKAPFSAAIDPLCIRILVVSSTGEIPDLLAEQLRRLELLDVNVVSQADIAATPNGKYGLVVIVADNIPAQGISLPYVEMMNNPSIDTQTTAVLEFSGDELILRAMQRSEIRVATRCEFDDSRFRRILATLQS